MRRSIGARYASAVAMASILLIRHGETSWNKGEVFRGRKDVPLSEMGLDQARLVAQAMAGRALGSVYSSPLARAVETAQPVARQAGLEVTVDERLVDMDFGDWEGLSRDEVAARWPELYACWVATPERFRAPNGESLSEVLARAWPVIEEAAEPSGGSDVLLVSHRVVCKLLLCRALGAGGAQFWRLRVDTASVSVLERAETGWQVRQINDTSHLRSLGATDAADF